MAVTHPPCPFNEPMNLSCSDDIVERFRRGGEREEVSSTSAWIEINGISPRAKKCADQEYCSGLVSLLAPYTITSSICYLPSQLDYLTEQPA